MNDRSTTRSIDPDAAKGLTGWHVLFGLLAFFGVIFAVNGVFLYQALSTHTGVVANEPYRKGLAYNTRVAADEQQSDRGWTAALAVTPGGRITLDLSDRQGTGVAGLQVEAVVARPATARHDRMLRLAEYAPGRYGADAGALEDGSWIVSIEARERRDAEPVFRTRRRLWLKP